MPDGARLVVWPIVNLEVWDISRPMARQVLPAPTGQVLLPDVPELGVARIRHAGRRVALLRPVRSPRHPPDPVDQRAVCEDYPRVAAAAREAGWEFMGHAYEQMPIHQVDDQKAMIASRSTRSSASPAPGPMGWLGPGLTETYETPELLAGRRHPIYRRLGL